MRPAIRSMFASAAALTGLWLTAGVTTPALAERADRSKPIVIEADQPGTIDLQRQIVVFNGNVTIAQGTMTIRAERVEVLETPDGYRTATAVGSAGRPATYRQKRDTADESIEGVADRIEFDQRADTLRLTGNAAVRRLRGAQVADEINGSAIVWDNRTELFSVLGGAPSPSNPSGRVRAVLSPRQEAASAAPPAGAAPLKPSKTLGEPR